MTNTEKAISLLQQCLDEWPYAAVRVYQIMSCIQEAVDLLKEQEPVAPKKQEETRIWTVCGNCSQHLISKWTYCPYCGQKVKWDE